MKHRFHGFTLIEVLIVLALMGLILGTVFVGIGDVREQSRNQQRVSDIKIIRLALQKYFSECKSYPSDIYGGDRSDDCARSDRQFSNFLSETPIDPHDENYEYVGLRASVAGKCVRYHIGAVLEGDSGYLKTDDDFDSTTSGYISCGRGRVFNGADESGVYDFTNIASQN